MLKAASVVRSLRASKLRAGKLSCARLLRMHRPLSGERCVYALSAYESTIYVNTLMEALG
jgi:hypothetical protein